MEILRFAAKSPWTELVCLALSLTGTPDDICFFVNWPYELTTASQSLIAVNTVGRDHGSRSRLHEVHVGDLIAVHSHYVCGGHGYRGYACRTNNLRVFR